MVLTSFLTHDLELTIALNNGMSEPSGCMGNLSVQLVWRDRVRQLSTTPLNSFKQGKTRQRTSIHRDTAREKFVNRLNYRASERASKREPRERETETERQGQRQRDFPNALYERKVVFCLVSFLFVCF